ncbi:PQQ-dependent sugar dehydrogenase [Kribbella sp. NBC_01245]|uniref:PQQ-dependent sugar dehydrogenase n=1 Tax=Kribbella sp. NBC_01245 TaxID=2903578 RepID=UPI002E2B5BEE|nr:PQQ-dependent sugar dehydrogenase [Kribbella sp. NBC_01245]
MPKFRSLFLLFAGVALAAPFASTTAPASISQDAPILDPITDNPVVSGLGLVVKEYASFPKSEPTPPTGDPRLDRQARINYLSPVPDRSSRLAVPDLNGKLYLLRNGQPREYLDVGATFAPDFVSSRGLGSGFGFVAFHPEFARNGRFYTVHTEWGAALTKPTDLPTQSGTKFHGVITEWTASDPTADAFAGTRREVIRLGYSGQVHGIQQIGFRTTAHRGDTDYGQLYIASGDGGLGVVTDDPQNLAIPQGKILRIDPRGTNSASGRYGVPASNPFIGRPGALGEIWAYGMRDPHRFSWDGRRMLLGHIGEHEIEAVYDVRAGDNLGWNQREGHWVFSRTDRCNLNPLPADDASLGYTYPVAAYDHDPPPGLPCTADSGHAISGGFVYRGYDVPRLRGKYVFADLVDGRVMYAESRAMRRGQPLAKINELMVYDATGKRVKTSELAGHSRVDLRLGTDARGELYLLSKANGKIWKVVGTRQFANCRTNGMVVVNTAGARNWAPVTPAKWQFPGNEVVLAEAGVARPGPRRPFEYAVLTKGPVVGNVRIDAEVRLDAPVSVANRDVIIVFGHRSDTEFYYAHLSSDNTIYPHNGIFVVNNADRFRLDDQWKPANSIGAKPAITDEAWHRIRVTHCASTGEIAVYVDGRADPLITAVDKTFTSGRTGFGSFDNTGRLRHLTLTATRP